jgi:hypothetical protein
MCPYTTTQVLLFAAVMSPAAPGLRSATKSGARNHGGENKKQNLNQTSGVC